MENVQCALKKIKYEKTTGTNEKKKKTEEVWKSLREEADLPR